MTWDSTTVPDGPHAVSATATDTIGQTDSDSNGITVDNVADPTAHIGDLDGSAVVTGPGGKWRADVVITAHDAGDNPVAGATVDGAWSDGTNGSGSCITDASGQCSISREGIGRKSSSVTFTVTGLAHASLVYASGDNHDPDADSDGTVIVVTKP